MNIGVLGGGQLGRMLALSGIPLGHTFTFLDPSPDACAASAGSLIVGEYDDQAALRTLAEQSDVVTYEFENLPVESVGILESLVEVFPSKLALQTAQDRLAEKTLCQDQGISVAQFVTVENAEALQRAVDEIEFPCLLKTRRMGYDGKGQVLLQSGDDLPAAEQLVEQQPCILERCVSFEKEVSIIASRSKDGAVAYYPLTENVHQEGILHTSRSPARVSSDIETQARSIAETLLTHFEYVGTLAIELFIMPDDTVLLNELAPRVHNSGHWTIEGAETSQFENHIRAICGLPLGSTALCGHSGMLNIIGTYPSVPALMSMEGVHVHLYGKEERPKRKIGHVTIVHDDEHHVASCLQAMQEAVSKAHQ